MANKAISALKELFLSANKQMFPNVPTHARCAPKYNDKTANGLTKCIIDFINLSGGFAERINNTGRQIDKRTTYTDVIGNTKTIGSINWIKGTGTNGTADISATIKGLSIKVEVKIGTDKQSEAQKEYQLKTERSGGIYFIAKDFDSFYNWFNLKFNCNGNAY